MTDLLFLIPELSITGVVILVLLSGAFLKQTPVRYFAIAGFGVLLAVLYALSKEWGESALLFNGLLQISPFVTLSKFIIVLAALFALLFIHGAAFTQSWITFETVVLTLLATLGMLLLVSANHLLCFYVALELMSLSLYILAAQHRDNVLSAEAGLKYFVLGALGSGLFLFGCSLVYGFSGTADFTKLQVVYSHGHLPIGALLGLILILVALFFKMSAAPFHMWTPDVYQGAPTVITAFFASAPKATALAVTLRFLMVPMGGVAHQWQQVTIVVSVLTMIVGAVAALRQTNIKRLLAYSSIGHVGYLLIGISAVSQAGAEAVLNYLLIYVIMTAGTFGAVLQLKKKGEPAEALDDLKGFASREPVLAAVMAIFMLSMAGIPPMAGFFAKFYIFLAAIDAGLYPLAVIGVLTSVIAAFYYLKIIKLMYFDDAKGVALDGINVKFAHKLVIKFTVLFTLFFFIYPTPVLELVRVAAQSLVR